MLIEFVNFLNAGDFYEKNMLNLVYTNCIKYKNNFIGYGNTILFDELSEDINVGTYYQKKNIFSKWF